MDAQPLSNRETPDEKIAAPAKPARRKRWWWQFSLRSLMLFVLVVAGANCWLSAFWHHKLEERRAVKELRNAGVDVAYDYQFNASGVRLRANPGPPGPAWIRALLGDDIFAEPTYAAVVDAQLPIDDVLKQIGRIASLKELDISWTAPSDRGIAELQSLPRLEDLDFAGNPMSDSAMESLMKLKSLRHLTLSSAASEQVKRLEAAIPGLKCELVATPQGQQQQ